MRHSIPFRDMKYAPKDGTPVEVQYGPEQETVHAAWSGQGQAWVRVDDPLRKTLHRVIGWRPVDGQKAF